MADSYIGKPAHYYAGDIQTPLARSRSSPTTEISCRSSRCHARHGLRTEKQRRASEYIERPCKVSSLSMTIRSPPRLNASVKKMLGMLALLIQKAL